MSFKDKLNMAKALHEPKSAFDALFEDLADQMRCRGVNEDAIKGMQIGLMLSFRLGEAHNRSQCTRRPDCPLAYPPEEEEQQ
jgi:hypothetical protein